MSATGLGSWPGADQRQAQDAVLNLLGAANPSCEGTVGIPYLVECPARGVGADIIGSGVGTLIDLPVDLQPSGWRFVDHPGRDDFRARAWRRSDLDTLAELAQGYSGPLKIQVCGPWTLLSAVRLNRGELAIADPGARRDVVDSLAEGVSRFVGDLARLVPDARMTVQIDEPSLHDVLLGRLRRQSGFGRLRAVEKGEVVAGIHAQLEAAEGAGAVRTALHCCADRPPVAVMREAGADALSLDLTRLDEQGWESVAVAIEEGRSLWAGVIPSTGHLPAVTDVRDLILRPWSRVGLPMDAARDVVVTPTCGLAGTSPQQAREITRRSLQVAEALQEN